MQPESSDANQVVNLSIETPARSQHQDFHHGRPKHQHLQPQQQCSSPFLHGEEGGNNFSARNDNKEDEDDNKTRDTDVQEELSGSGLCGLNSGKPATPPRKAYSPVNRITEYERAFS